MTKFIRDQAQRFKDDLSFTCRRRIGQKQEISFDFWLTGRFVLFFEPHRTYDCVFMLQELEPVRNSHWLPNRGYQYYSLDNWLEQSIFSKILLLTMSIFALEFPIMYAILSPMAHWHTVFIQIAVLFVDIIV